LDFDQVDALRNQLRQMLTMGDGNAISEIANGSASLHETEPTHDSTTHSDSDGWI
jgi:hypothetical protein